MGGRRAVYIQRDNSKMEESSGEPLGRRVQKWFIDLTNELIKNYKVSNMAYLVIKVLEYMQFTYFVMRVETSYHWNFSFVSYLSIFVNYTVADSNIRLSATIFQPLLYLVVVSLLLVILLGLVIGVQAGWGKKMPVLIKVLIPLLNIFLYFFKYILAVPTLQLIFICFSPQAQAKLGIDSSGVTVVLGVLILVTFLLVKVYIIVLYRESNPFSEMQHAGESVSRACFIFAVKLLLSLYSILDLSGAAEGILDIVFVVVWSLMILQSHYEIGLYRAFPRWLQFKLMYTVLSVGLLQALDYYSPYEVTSFTFVIPYLFFGSLISDWVLEWQQRRAILLDLVLNNSPEWVETHVLRLIELIDSLEVRANRIKLEGYMHLHRRECRGGAACPCQGLGFVRERNEELIKVQYFKLVVALLGQSRRKYKEYQNMDLFLGLVYHFRIKNPLQAIYAFTKLVTGHKQSLISRLYVSYYLQRVEEDMRELEEKESARTSDINKYLEYTNRMVVFEQHVENCTKHHVEFWRLMLDSSPEIKRLEDLGTLITRNKDYLKEEFEQIFEHNPSSIHLLTIYGKFLLEVTNEEGYNVKYLEKADSILNNIKYSSKIDEALSKYNENAQTGVIVINGNEGELGNIIHTNNLIRHLLGYRRNELLDHNVEAIMPKIYGDSHNAILNRYIAASESKVNGHERIVPALNKAGFIIPVNALTKALPSLLNGIQIVGFLAKMEENFKEDDEGQRGYNYLLYRTDSEQVLGISEGCYEEFHIHPSLVYGNANNLNNELRIKHLFGVSFERSEEGKIAAALEAGEVEMTINTKALKDEFIISKSTSSDNLLDLDDQQPDREGVETEIVARNILVTLYMGVTLKLIAIYQKKPALLDRPSKRGVSSLYQKPTAAEPRRDKIFEEATKTDSDDFKNLKDFKNFISVKSQPSAITAISTICICFLLLVSSSTVGLLVNWAAVVDIHSNMMSLSRLTLYTELATPELLAKTEKAIIALSAPTWNVTASAPAWNLAAPSLTSQTLSELASIITSLKSWQLSILPYKYRFNSGYGDRAVEYWVTGSGKVNSGSRLLEEAISDYISQVETISLTNISVLANFSADLQSNVYQKYAGAKMGELYSLRAALNASNANHWAWYSAATATATNAVVAIAVLMIAAIALWLALLLPYVLSVTKINNRVLSLFSLIPYAEICRLIHGCLLFLSLNLSEADVNSEDLRYYEAEQSGSPRRNEGQLSPSSVLHSPSMHSPSMQSPSMMSDNSFTQSNMVKRGEQRWAAKDSVLVIEEKFEKMKNSEDRNKKVVIGKFLLISLVVLGFVLFYLFFSLTVLAQASTALSNYQTLGRRTALIRNSKLLLTEYLISPNYAPLSNAASIKTLALGIITEFYNLEASLLSLSLGTSQATYSAFNNGDVCSMLPAYSGFSLFGEALSANECYAVHSQILQKGVKTGIVDALESIRSLVSQYNGSSVPRAALVANAAVFEALVKYIETPMLAVLSSVEGSLSGTIGSSQVVMLVVGGVFVAGLLASWRVLWTRYLSELNVKIWRTKGLLNLIPMRIITSNDLLKNEFTSGQLENAVR